MERTFKIIYHLGAKKVGTCSWYAPNVYKKLKENIELFFKENNISSVKYRTFWIDPDLNEIVIVRQDDYDIFNYYRKGNPLTPLHVAPVDMKMATAAVHINIKCDACQMKPIMGYRYKCIQCSSYDLCQNCESLHFHSDHMMVRMSTPNCPIDEYIVGSDTECKSSASATHFSNIEMLIAAAATATAAKMAEHQSHETIYKAAEIAAKVAHKTALKAIKSFTQIINAPTSISSPVTTDGGEIMKDQTNKKVDAITSSLDSEAQAYTNPVPILNNFNDMITKILDLMEKSASCKNQNIPDLRKNSTTFTTKSSALSNLDSMGSEIKCNEEKSMRKDSDQGKAKENKKTSGDPLLYVEIDDSVSEAINVSESLTEINNTITKYIATPSSSSSKSSTMPATIASGQPTAFQSMDKLNLIDFVQINDDQDRTKENIRTSGAPSLYVELDDSGSDSEAVNACKSSVEKNKENIATPSTSSKLSTVRIGFSCGQPTALQSLDKSNVIDLIQINDDHETDIFQKARRNSLQSVLAVADTL